MTNPSSTGSIHFQLQVPHAGFADYCALQSLLVAPFLRPKARKYSAIGFVVGGITGLLIVVAAIASRLWVLPTLVIGLDEAGDPIVAQGLPVWIALILLVFAVIMLNSVCSKLLARAARRAMFETSLRNFPTWSLALRDDGMNVTVGDMTSTVPWTSVSSLHHGPNASFIVFRPNLNGIVVSYRAFANPDERARCLAFLQEKIGRRQS